MRQVGVHQGHTNAFSERLRPRSRLALGRLPYMQHLPVDNIGWRSGLIPSVRAHHRLIEVGEFLLVTPATRRPDQFLYPFEGRHRTIQTSI